MGRKDRERFQRLRETNADYVGYRGSFNSIDRSRPSATETVVCSVCQRKKNVAINTLPEDIRQFICLRCQQSAISYR